MQDPNNDSNLALAEHAVVEALQRHAHALSDAAARVKHFGTSWKTEEMDMDSGFLLERAIGMTLLMVHELFELGVISRARSLQASRDYAEDLAAGVNENLVAPHIVTVQPDKCEHRYLSEDRLSCRACKVHHVPPACSE